MQWVKIRHPASGGEAVVATTALPEHARAGWVPVDEDPVPETALAGNDGAAPDGGGENSSEQESQEEQ